MKLIKKCIAGAVLIFIITTLFILPMYFVIVGQFLKGVLVFLLAALLNIMVTPTITKYFTTTR